MWMPIRSGARRGVGFRGALTVAAVAGLGWCASIAQADAPGGPGYDNSSALATAPAPTAGGDLTAQPTQFRYSNGSGGAYYGSAVYDIAPVYARVAYARSEYNRAANDLNVTMFRLRREFETSDEYRRAQQEVSDARAAYDAARKPVLDQVAADERYATLVEKRSNVDTAMKTSDGRLRGQDRIDLATRKMDYAAEARRMEAQALAADANVQQAKARLVAAQQHVRDLNNHFDQTFAQNPSYAAAKAAYDQARTNMAVADAYLAGAYETRDDTRDADTRRHPYPNQYQDYGVAASYGFPYGAGYYGFGSPLVYGR